MSREYPCVYYDDQKCRIAPEDGVTDWCVLGPCSHETPSKADRIRAMSDEELAEFLGETISGCMRHTEWCETDDTCEGCFKTWLKQPHKEDA